MPSPRYATRAIPPPGGDRARARRIEALILHGHQRDWLAYLTEAVDAIELSRDSPTIRASRTRGRSRAT